MAIYSSHNLKPALDHLQQGQCIGFPTETVYGLAANALDPHAVARVFETKKRPSFDPLIVHVSSQMDLSEWVEITPTAQALMDHFWPGPLTLLLKKTEQISDLITSGHPTVALRCPAHPVAQAILRQSGFPLVASSANPFGKISPTTAEAVDDGFKGNVKVIVDGGDCKIGLESTIVDTTHPYPHLPILRFGGIAMETLSALGYELSYPTPIIGQAPGTLKNHYAPNTPLYLLRSPLPQLWWDDPQLIRWTLNQKSTAYLTWDRVIQHEQSACLTPQSDSIEAASRLFKLMRTLDQSSAQQIIVEPIPQKGLGQAIADRLKRASSGWIDLD
jgi:L-threonylcarbamoyladenylate synthase